MYILKIRSKTTCFGLTWPLSGFFSFTLKFRYINCDVEISHPIIILVCLCLGGYYITLMYIYIYIFSLLVGGVYPGGVNWMSTSSSSGGCCHEAVDGWPSGKEKPLWWPYKAETCCFTFNLRIYIFYVRYELCFCLPSHLSNAPAHQTASYTE